LHLVPSVPHGDERLEKRHPALSCSGFLPDKVPHTGDIPAVSAARHVMNVPVVLRFSSGTDLRSGSVLGSINIGEKP